MNRVRERSIGTTHTLSGIPCGEHNPFLPYLHLMIIISSQLPWSHQKFFSSCHHLFPDKRIKFSPLKMNAGTVNSMSFPWQPPVKFGGENISDWFSPVFPTINLYSRYPKLENSRPEELSLTNSKEPKMGQLSVQCHMFNFSSAEYALVELVLNQNS